MLNLSNWVDDNITIIRPMLMKIYSSDIFTWIFAKLYGDSEIVHLSSLHSRCAKHHPPLRNNSIPERVVWNTKTLVSKKPSTTAKMSKGENICPATGQ